MDTFDTRPLWTQEDLGRWARSPNVLVRAWTCWRLAEQPPSPDTTRLLTDLLGDADPQVQRHAAEALAYLDCTEAPGPLVTSLLAYLKDASPGLTAGYTALALARLGERSFVPEAVRLLQFTTYGRGPGWSSERTSPDDEETALLLVRALGRAATRTALAALRRVARAGCTDSVAGEVATMLARHGTASDVREVVQWYRRRERGPLDPVFLAIPDGLGLTRRLVALAGVLASGGWASVAEELRQMIGSPTPPSSPVEGPGAFGPSPGFLRRLHATGRARLAGLVADGPSPFLPCVRRLVWLLGALGAQGHSGAAGVDEVLLGLAGAEMLEQYAEAHRLARLALGTVSGPGHRRRTDLAAASDPAPAPVSDLPAPEQASASPPGKRPESLSSPVDPRTDPSTLLKAWSLEVPFVPSEWEEILLKGTGATVLELGRILLARPDGWAARRTARLLRRLGHSGSSAAGAARTSLLHALGTAGPNRVELARALAAQGGAALPDIARSLPGTGDEREVLLTALSLIPVRASVAHIHLHWQSFLVLGPARIAEAALTLGALDLLPLLRQLWQPGQPEVASAILILAALHGVTLDQAEWPDLVQDVLAARITGPGLPGRPPDSVHESRAPYMNERTG